jgi:hypothetical protein
MDTKQDLPTFDHSAADFKEVGPRRAYMEQYFRALGLRNQVEEIRAQELEERCAKLREKRNKKVSQLYFEYALDYGVWYNLRKFYHLVAHYLLTASQSALATCRRRTILGLMN